jgi:hypothetical protein
MVSKAQESCLLYAAGTNKIRMEYIETEMSKRQNRNDAVRENLEPQNTTINDHAMQPSGPRSSQREPATLGKLHEIDLGHENKLQNIARTVAATRRLAGGENVDSEDDSASTKPRIGKDGKPWRGRRRRNSEDIERDRLVEEVLRESKCKFGTFVVYLVLFSDVCYSASI